MASASTTTMSYIYKSVYSGKKPEDLASRDRVLWGKMKKTGGFTGDNHIFSLTRQHNIGISPSITGAQAIADYNRGDKFTLTASIFYGVGTIDGVSILKAGDDKGSFVRLVTTTMDGTLEEMGHRLSQYSYGDGSGSIGQCSNDPTDAGGPITLTNVDDAKNFKVGMIIRANPTKSGTAGNFRTGSGTVTTINEETGSIAYSGTITGITTSDYIYPASSATDTSEYDGVIKGVGAWIPRTDPTSATFYGVDRTVDMNKLSGWRVTTTSNSMEENLVTLGAKLKRARSKAKDIFVSPMNWAVLVKNAESKVIRDQGGEAQFGFSAVKIATPNGLANVWADPDCPADTGWFLDLDTWECLYLGDGIPHLIMDDDLNMLRQSTADGVEYRFRAIGQIKCNAPGRNGVFQIS